MRKFKPAYCHEVDLDNPKTYDHLPNTYKKLDDLMFRCIGYAMVYMDFFPDRKDLFPKEKQSVKLMKFPNGKKYDVNNCTYKQRLRINKLITNFAKNRQKNYNNLLWYKEQIFLFQDEIENMC